MNKRIALVIPPVVALLVGLLSNALGYAQPGLLAGAFLVVGFVIYFIWAKQDHNETKGKG